LQWVNHKLVTGSLVFAITGNPFLSLISAAGSIVPDAIERIPIGKRLTHRQLSHWWIPYLAAFYLSYSSASQHGVLSITLQNIYDLVFYQYFSSLSGFLVIAYFSLGGLLHIAEDAFCGTVPGITIHHRIGIKLFKVGSPREYLIAFSLSFLLLSSRLHLGWL
jgi:hypothetical protein